MTLIETFDVAPDEDDDFIAAWERARHAATLHRAWRRDAKFRFVGVARVDSPRAHPNLYEVVHEDGAPDGTEGVVLINPFEVPANEDERFLAGWERARESLARQRGYLGTRLYRSLAPDADLRFVDIARWSSPLAFSRAVQTPEYRGAAEAMAFASHPALYQVMPAPAGPGAPG